jgi:hypothetical protein
MLMRSARQPSRHARAFILRNDLVQESAEPCDQLDVLANNLPFQGDLC